jgi:hypothetical protein
LFGVSWIVIFFIGFVPAVHINHPLCSQQIRLVIAKKKKNQRPRVCRSTPDVLCGRARASPRWDRSTRSSDSVVAVPIAVKKKGGSAPASSHKGGHGLAYGVVRPQSIARPRSLARVGAEMVWPTAPRIERLVASPRIECLTPSVWAGPSNLARSV